MDRRRFLGTSLKAGIGLAGGGLVGGALLGGQAAAAGPSSWPQVAPPGSPPSPLRYVTRPDLTPPGVKITTTPGFPYSSSQPRYIFLSPTSPGGKYPAGTQHGLMILDLRGDVVWFQPQVGPNTNPYNFRVQTYKGQPVLTWFQGTSGYGFGTSGEYHVADNSYARIATVTASNYPCDLHEFLITPEDTALHTAYQQHVAGPGGTKLVVGHAQEVDVATNGLVYDWPCYPAVSPADSYTGPSGDYFHINSIDLWPGSARNLLISSRNTCAVYLVDRATKQIIWRLAGKRSTFRLGAGVAFAYQHDARPLADGSGLSLFDDASRPARIESQSSGKVISLDVGARTATLRHQYFHTDGAFDTPSQGNCQLLPNGGHMVGWGAVPYFSCYRASGNSVQAEMVLDGRLPTGVDSYRSFMFDWVGNPAQDELRLVVHPTGGTGHFTGWVSWNGATEVAAWRMNAGPSASSLDVISTVAKRSFETPINFTRVGAKAFQVAALDSRGGVITRSPVVAAT